MTFSGFWYIIIYRIKNRKIGGIKIINFNSELAGKIGLFLGDLFSRKNREKIKEKPKKLRRRRTIQIKKLKSSNNEDLKEREEEERISALIAEIPVAYKHNKRRW